MGRRRWALNTEEILKQSRNFDDYDSDDEEDLRNTIGNVPVKWYDGEEHAGYDHDGNRISKPPKKSEIETFMEKMEDPDYWRKVLDVQTGCDAVLTDEQVDVINALNQGRYPTVGYNPYQPFVDLYSSQKEIHPMTNNPESKQSFTPSLDERRIVGRMVYAFKMGWIKPKKPKEAEKQIYDIWAEEDSERKTKSELARIRMHFPAPKVPLPGHSESYNPPPEYLFSEDEHKSWQETEPELRRQNFVPQKYNCLRHVPAYELFFNERFERCLDLFLAPRKQKMKLNVDPSDLLPDLPNPADLRPFPTTFAFAMKGHNAQVRCMCFEPQKSEILVSGGIDGTCRFWSIGNGRCMRVETLGSPVTSVQYCPKTDITLVAAATEDCKIHLFSSMCGDRLLNASTRDYLFSLDCGTAKNDHIQWTRDPNTGHIVLTLSNAIRQVTWHAKGDYFASVAAVRQPDSLVIHQLSKCNSQVPFSRSKGTIINVLFHPQKPHLFVSTQRHIRIYDLAKCQQVKKVLIGTRWLGCMELDPSGNNLFVGGLDRVFAWIDLQLSAKPWKTLIHHSAAIRDIAYHRRSFCIPNTFPFPSGHCVCRKLY
ncbi:hypothetical protein AB6A40_010524 [Gnathostoma spinigerum]|uniref:BOP1 N-terminal domain-containing protein n=1 Tax=Gnathostoma spinigerum TaxID=75299 RepID=A0ABD6EWE6_9BILA